MVMALDTLNAGGMTHCTLVFSHPEMSWGLTDSGIPQVNLDQMNPRRMMSPSFYSAMMVGVIGGCLFLIDRTMVSYWSMRAGRCSITCLRQ